RRALLCRGRAGLRHRHRHGALAPFARPRPPRPQPRALRRREGGRLVNTEPPVLDPGQETLLDLKLDALRAGIGELHAPGAMEAALVKQFRKARPASHRPRLWWMPPLALAATIALASWILRGPVPEGDALVTMAPQRSLDGDG